MNDKILSRVLNKQDYKEVNSHDHFDLTENIVCFFNGKNWMVIKLEDMLAYPLLYFDFWSEKDNTTYHNTLLVCPITLRSMIYKGVIQIIDIINNDLKLLNTDTNDEFMIHLPYTGHYDDKGNEKKIKSHVKRHQVNIMTLRDCFSSVLDPIFIIPIKKESPIINIEYYSNRNTIDGKPINTTIHPKNIVYMIQYYSHKSEKYKYNVIVGKNISTNQVSKYEYKASGIWHYIEEHKKKLIKRRAYIYPILWYITQEYQDIHMITI